MKIFFSFREIKYKLRNFHETAKNKKQKQKQKNNFDMVSKQLSTTLLDYGHLLPRI